MDDLISRQRAIDGLDGHRVERRCLNDWQIGWNEALDWVQESYLEDLPSAQSEQKVGRWIKISPAGVYQCSNCGRVVMTCDISAYKFCHQCGWMMKEGGQNEE